MACYLVGRGMKDVVMRMRPYNLDLIPFVNDGRWKFIRLFSPLLRRLSKAIRRVPMEGRLVLDEETLSVFRVIY